MKRRRYTGGIALLLVGFLAPAEGRTQGSERELVAPTAIPLEDFRLSAPPAMTLLGAGASAVSRPNTPRDLIASLVSGAGSDGIVPDGISIETAPFWLTRHRGLTLREYHHSSLMDRLKYFTAISAGTSRDRQRGDSVNDATVALAIRTLVANGRPSRALLAAGDSIRAQQLAYIETYRRWEAAHARATGIDARRKRLTQHEELLESLTLRVLVGPETSLRDSAMRTLARRDSLRAQIARNATAEAEADGLDKDLDRIEAKLGATAKEYASEEIEPEGFILEVAGGFRTRFHGAQWGRSSSDGVGIWITPMYRFAGSNAEIIGVARYLHSVNEYSGRSLFDFGARAGVEIGKGSVSAEHVWRNLAGTSSTDLVPGAPPYDSRETSTRWSALFDYPIGGKLWLVASFGSDYRRSGGDRPVIATIGINLGFGAVEILPSRR